MPRAKRGVKGARRRNRVMKLAEGYYSSRHRLMRTAMEAVSYALKTAYVGRRLKKRDFRSLWQARISAAAKQNGTSYSRLMGNLKKGNVELNRKMLSELAIHHPEDFTKVVELAGK